MAHFEKYRFVAEVTFKHFRQDKEIGSWFGKLLPISSMDICQHQEAIEPGRKAPETNGQEANPEESHDEAQTIKVESFLITFTFTRKNSELDFQSS